MLGSIILLLGVGGKLRKKRTQINADDADRNRDLAQRRQGRKGFACREVQATGAGGAVLTKSWLGVQCLLLTGNGPEMDKVIKRRSGGIGRRATFRA